MKTTRPSSCFMQPLACVFGLLLAVGTAAAAQGAKASSTTATKVFVLPNQWGVVPVGQSLELGEFPFSLAVSPDGRRGAVVHCGAGAHEVRVVDLQSRAVVSSAPLANAWGTAAWSPDGVYLYVSKGADDALARFRVTEGVLEEETAISLQAAEELAPGGSGSEQNPQIPHLPSGIVLSRDGRTAYVTEFYGNRLLRVSLGEERSSATVFCRFEGANARPHSIVLHPSRDVAYVSLLGADAVAEVDLKSGAVERIRTDPHPGAMVITRDGRRIFVACSNSNYVDEIDTKWRMVEQSISTALFPSAPLGSTPSALALSPDEVFLAVANSDNNNLALFDVRMPGAVDPLGYIPTGVYPTAVGYTSGMDLVVVNGKGEGTPRPSGAAGPDLRGSIQFVNKLTAESVWEYTHLAYSASPLRGDFAPVGAQDRESTNPVPRSLEERSPIFYVVYIIKGSATYDQVLGDIPGGRGEPALCEYGEKITPNAHALAREFVLLDNFYAEAEGAADGVERSTGAYASANIERLWPSIAGEHGRLPWPAGGHDPVAVASTEKLWDRAAEAGVDYRSYGVYTAGGGPGGAAKPLAKSLEDHQAPGYPAPGTGVSNAVRAKEFLQDLDRYNRESILPRLTIIRLPAEGGNGATAAAIMAEQDQALGEIMAGLAKSRFWKALAVFVVEECAAGPDGVHPQRSPALLAGPWVKRGEVIKTRYSTSSVLRTIELLLGLEPMSQYDAAARPMYECFSTIPELKPFKRRE